MEPPAPPEPVPAAPSPELPEQPPPDDPASPALCRAACQRVAGASMSAEHEALERFQPGLVPATPAPILDQLRAPVEACVEACVRSTPRSMAECLAAARDAPQVSVCLDP